MLKRWFFLGWAYAVFFAYLYSIWAEKISKEIAGLL